jgi:formate hydrogenlyase subunit 6/NADH:ubiquinone oxidoreductase subunit I
VGTKHRIELLKKGVLSIFVKPATSMYPTVKPKKQTDTHVRGQPLFDTQLCIGCGLCCKECPSKAIEMVMVEEKKRPQFRLDKCIFCTRCTDVCCKHAITTSPHYELATTDKSSLIIKPKPFVQKPKSENTSSKHVSA